jgi:hypothetical protein
MNTGPTFWLIIATGASVLVGVALAYGMISRRARRRSQERDSAQRDAGKDRW